jgi:hypothetical protein
MTIENEELSDSQLFNDSVGEEVNPETPVVEQKTEKPEGEVIAETPDEKPVVDDNAPLIPSWRLREIREERDAVTARLAAAEARLAQQPKADTPKVEQPDHPDPLLDPKGYAAAVREEIRQEMLADRRETSLQNAWKTYKGEFEEAYNAARNKPDAVLNAQMQQSRDVGETLIQWHRDNKNKLEIGGDLNAYQKRIRDEATKEALEGALKDPEFRQRAMETWRNGAQSQSNGRPRVELPPSLSGTSRAALRSSNDDVSDAELFDQTTG